MEKQLSLTKIPNLGLIVIRQQAGTRFFVSAPNSIIIDRYGMRELIKGMISIGFLDSVDISSIIMDKGESNEN